MEPADLIAREHDAILRSIATAIAERAPEYNVGVHHQLARLRARVLKLSLDALIDEIRHGQAGAGFDFSPHRELGRLEYAQNRTLGDLLQAPWAAALELWRVFVGAARTAAIDSSDLDRLAGIVMEWSGRISMALSEGYHEEMAASAGALETRKRRLVELILRNPPPSAALIAEAVEDAGSWRLPSRLGVLVVSGPDADALRRGLPAGSLAADISDSVVALLPSTTQPRDLDVLDAMLTPGTVAAVGPQVDVTNAHRSVERARAAIKLVEEGVFDAARVVRCDEHTLELVVLSDPAMAQDHVDRWLKPLEAARPSMRRQLEATLASWLRHQGSAAAAAHELGVHPHTIGYRLGRLRDLLGPTIDDPDRRFELHLALRVRGMLENRSGAAGP